MANAHSPFTEINAIVLSADYAIKSEGVRRLRNAKNVLRKDGRKKKWRHRCALENNWMQTQSEWG